MLWLIERARSLLGRAALREELSSTVGTTISGCAPYRPGGRSLVHPVLILDEWRRSSRKNFPFSASSRFIPAHWNGLFSSIIATNVDKTSPLR
jgi:hypothetical protein